MESGYGQAMGMRQGQGQAMGQGMGSMAQGMQQVGILVGGLPVYADGIGILDLSRLDVTPISISNTDIVSYQKYIL